MPFAIHEVFSRDVPTLSLNLLDESPVEVLDSKQLFFENVSYVIMLFKKQTGMTPLRYRSRYGQERY